MTHARLKSPFQGPSDYTYPTLPVTQKKFFRRVIQGQSSVKGVRAPWAARPGGLLHHFGRGHPGRGRICSMGHGGVGGPKKKLFTRERGVLEEFRGVSSRF